MPTNINDVIAKLPPEERKIIKDRTAQLIEEEMKAQQARKALAPSRRKRKK